LHGEANLRKEFIHVLADTSREVKKLDSWHWIINIWRPQGILFWVLGGISPVDGIAYWKTVQNLDWEDEIYNGTECRNDEEKGNTEYQ
jgi:hypothetical protein